ncbi:MAG: anti-sigma factor [Gemmatimonadetes bacterium]|nr:anti-sigma factor [Gemmatimonadota bacterium]
MSRTGRYTCEDAFRRLDDYLDRALTPDERNSVEAHLRECEACASEFRFESTFVDDVRSKLKRIVAPSDLLERISQGLARGVGNPPAEG